MSERSPTGAGISPAITAKVDKMSANAEARSLVSEIAGPSEIGEKVKEAIDRVARATGLNHRRVRGIWNNEAKAILAEEMDALRRAARHSNEEAKARDELREMRARLDRFERILAAQGAYQGSVVGAVGQQSDVSRR